MARNTWPDLVLIDARQNEIDIKLPQEFLTPIYDTQVINIPSTKHEYRIGIIT
jgi:hypothetical protein